MRLRDRAHIVEETIIQTAIADGCGVIITLPNDPAGGGAYVKMIQKRLSEMGFICKLVKPTKSKVQRFAPFAAVAEGGFVNVVNAPWNEDFHSELEVFDGTNNYKDDQADACSDAFVTLNRDVQLPTFTLPDLSSPVNKNISTFSSNVTLPSSGMTLPSYNF